MRDLEDPELWIESYQTPTWVDYVRHNQRRTQADAASVDRLRALHRGAGAAAGAPPHRPPGRAGPPTSPTPKPPIDHH